MCPREAQIKADVDIMRKFGSDVINKKRRTVESGGKLGQDLISRFIDKKDSSLNLESSRSGGQAVDDLQTRELQDIVSPGLLNFCRVLCNSSNSINMPLSQCPRC